jgi:hypothetical protein
MFWELRTIAVAAFDDGLADWKAVVTVAAFEMLAIFGFTSSLSAYLGHKVIEQRGPFVFLVGFAVAALNTPAMLSNFKRWHILSREFERYSYRTRIAGGIVVVLLFFGALISAAYFGAEQRNLP